MSLSLRESKESDIILSMVKEIWIVVFGVLVAVMPFLGFPGLWKTIFYVFIGLTIATLSVLIQFRKTSEIRSSLSENGRRTDMYVENGVKASKTDGKETDQNSS